MSYTPPMVMRHLIPWPVLYWIGRHTKTCGSGLAMWKMGYEDWEWSVRRSCWDGPNGGWDYCNKYASKPEFEEAQS